MAKTTAQLLSQLDDLIDAMQQAFLDGAVQEYYIGSRRIRRSELGPTLDHLYANRRILRRELAAESGTNRRIRVAKLGNAQSLDR